MDSAFYTLQTSVHLSGNNGSKQQAWKHNLFLFVLITLNKQICLYLICDLQMPEKLQILEIQNV